MDIYTIYIATNKLNGKNYIGFDSKWPKRKYEHYYNSTVGSSNQAFYNAIRKYGWDNFEWNIIYQSYDAEYTLTVMENHFINEYHSYIHFQNSNGYNMTMGGEGTVGHIHTLETRNKISNALLGKTKGILKPPKTIEARQNISKSKKGQEPWNKGKSTGQLPWNKGKTNIYSEEQIQHLRELALNRRKGKVWYNDGINEYFVFPEQINENWVKGRIMKKRILKLLTCPHCNSSGSGGNMTRYHFDNCKNKKGT